jgi:hypothetical protein
MLEEIDTKKLTYQWKEWTLQEHLQWCIIGTMRLSKTDAFNLMVTVGRKIREVS